MRALVIALVLGLSAYSAPAFAQLACDETDPLNPENDCDGDGQRVGQGDCDDDGELCDDLPQCDPPDGPYVVGCVCGERRGARTFIGAPEICDGRNNNCDAQNLIDEGLAVDVDNDSVLACGTCGAPDAPDCDCNDNDGNVRPGVTEVCDAIDNDCDGATDEDPSGQTLDRSCFPGPGTAGVGTCRAGTETCNATVPGVESYGACQGAIVANNPPGEDEQLCDGLDDDCDGTPDDGLVVDVDGDNFRACGTCGAPAAPDCDCNDNNNQIRPGRNEICDAVDQDCDGLIDERNAAGDKLRRNCFDGPADVPWPVTSARITAQRPSRRCSTSMKSPPRCATGR